MSMGSSSNNNSNMMSQEVKKQTRRRKRRRRRRIVSKDEVITKLKDDGDFDTLRLNIIRNLKQNEELRNNIISIVRQSAAINRPGAETMKPRQLSDAIYDEVGSKVMSQISNGLWEIIRSESDNGMKGEIKDTVKSVYDKLAEPEWKAEGESSTHGEMTVLNEADNSGAIKDPAGAGDANLSDNEPNEPPGFSLCNDNQNPNNEHKELRLTVQPEGRLGEHKEWPKHSQDVKEKHDVDLGVTSGFSADIEHNQPCDGSDEDPDVPPGFG